MASLRALYPSSNFWIAFKLSSVPCLIKTRESKSPNLVLSLGVLREIVDLLKGRFKGAVDSKTGKKLEEIEHALDSLEDMKANRKGIDCPPEKTCECCCNEYKVNGL